MKDGWRRYRWQDVCVCCKHGGRRGHCSGCCYLGDPEKPNVVLCLRTEKGAFRAVRDGLGWLHRINDDPHYVRPVARRQEARKVNPVIEAIHNDSIARMTPQLLGDLAESLVVSRDSLSRLSVGWGYFNNRFAYTFPMRDEANTVIGMRLRTLQGLKWAVAGSFNAIFIPRKLPCSGPIYVVEGPTDTAAMLTLGLCCAMW